MRSGSVERGLGLRQLDWEFFLSQQPLADTIHVEVEHPDGTRLVDLEVVYDAGRNSIRFVEYLPPALASVVLTYTVK